MAQGSHEKTFLKTPCSSGTDLKTLLKTLTLQLSPDLWQTNPFHWWEVQKNVKVNTPSVYLIYALLNTKDTGYSNYILR